MKKETLKKCIHFLKYCDYRTTNNNDFHIGRIVISHSDHIMSLSLEELSNEANLSIASISRFFKKAGFKSFNEFKVEFNSFCMHAKNNRMIMTLKNYQGMSYQDIAKIQYEQALANLNATYNSVSEEQLNYLINALKNNRKIILIGDDHELACFFTLQLDLLSDEKSAVFYNIDEVTLDDLKIFGNPLIIIISVGSVWYNHKTRDIIESNIGTNILIHQDGFEDLDCYKIKYGLENTTNDGYYSLKYLAKLIADYYYKNI